MRQALLFLIIFFSSLTLAELLLRLFAPVHISFVEDAYEYDPDLGFRLCPGIHEFRSTDFQHEVQVNALGSSNFQEDFRDYKTLVFTLGDSYTEGIGVPADATYPFHLDLLLNQDKAGMYSKQFAVINLGLSGFGGEQSLLALRKWAIVLRPPETIVYLGFDNDYHDDLLFKNGLRHRELIAKSPYWGWAGRPLRWLTYDLQIGLRTQIWLTWLKEKCIIRQTQQNDNKTVAELEKPELERLLQYSKEHKSLLVVGWAEEGRSYEWLKKWTGENRIRFVDWVPRVQSVRTAIPKIPMWNQHSADHYRTWVNHMIAEEVSHQIKKPSH